MSSYAIVNADQYPLGVFMGNYKALVVGIDVVGIRRDVRITPYYQQLNWLKINERRDKHVLLLLFEILKTGVPSYIFHYFLT